MPLGFWIAVGVLVFIPTSFLVLITVAYWHDKISILRALRKNFPR